MAICGESLPKVKRGVKVKVRARGADDPSVSDKGEGMVAGESARDLAKRQRDKAERLMRSAELYERGAEGEAATARALESLDAAEWTVFHDVRWPGRKLANVDHVAVGPGGVFVIDSKNWSGRIEVKDSVLRQNGYQREKTVVAAAEAASAVSLVTRDVQGRLAVPVLCFVRDEPLTGWARDVMVCSTVNVTEMLMSRPTVLDTETRRTICLGLDLSLRNAAKEQAVPAMPMSKRPAVTAVSYGSTKRTPSLQARSTRHRRRKKNLTWGDWVKGGIALAVVGSAVFAPSVYQGAMTGISGLIVEVVVPNTDPAPVEDAQKDEKKRQQGQSAK